MIYYIFLIINMFYIFIVFKSRIASISFLIILITIVFFKNIDNFLKILCSSIFMFMLVFILLNTNYGKMYLDSIDLDSTSVRSEAIEYYNNQTKDVIITGVGFINANNNVELKSFTMGNDGKFYKDDVGVINLLNTFGILGVLWYIFIIFTMIKIMKDLYKLYKIVEFIELISIFMLIIITSFTMIISDSQRIFTLPIALTIFDSYYKIYIKNKKLYIKEKK